jgi:hypothetical protein
MVSERFIRRCFAVLVLGVAFASTALAKDPLTYRLEPRAMKEFRHGKAVLVKRSAGRDGERFILEKISSTMPVIVALKPARAGEEVALRLTKYGWNQPLREGRTEDAPLLFKFRTEGEFQIAVTGGKEKTPYQLLVWVGDEIKPEFTPVVVKASEFEQKSGSLAWWLVGAAMAAMLAVAAVVVVRRRKSS